MKVMISHQSKCKLLRALLPLFFGISIVCAAYSQLSAYRYLPPTKPVTLVTHLERKPPRFIFGYARSLDKNERSMRNMLERTLRTVCADLRNAKAKRQERIEAGYALAHALGRFGPESISNIESLYRSRDPWIRELAGWALVVFAHSRHYAYAPRVRSLAERMQKERIKQLRVLGEWATTNLYLYGPPPDE